MNDKQPLSSEQALDDYFFDLLAEPAEEAAPEPEIVPVPDEPSKATPQEPAQDDTLASLPGDAREVAESASPEETPDELEDLSAAIEKTEPDASSVMSAEDNAVMDTEAADAATFRERDSDTAEGHQTPTASEPAAPFDFDCLSEASAEDEAVVAASKPLSVALDLSAPAGNVSGWAPQPQAQPASREWTLPDTAPETVTFADKPDLETVQRLLSQVGQLSPDHETQVETDLAVAVELADVAPEITAPESIEPEVTWDDVFREEAEMSQAVTAETAVPSAEPEVLATEAEVDEPEIEVALETQAGENEPPQIWQAGQDLGAEFQALFFEVNGVVFAVPLTELGGIHQLTQVNNLPGRPPWYLGLMTNREHQLDVVDTARWVMPERLSSDAHQEDYRYIVMLGESKWGLACHVLHGTETLTAQSVRWREQAGKRPWLAGMVKEKMCALIHVNELISMLNAGLDVKSVI
ncbi:chemotaxis protein CheW [Photobacterium atrarenae]|uniref:Chemotaxis protein CheW n=1 Tax=Photobacterium atrarenae TaxID=865757 RepID=A0ABY5GCP7_9GAMM|nr:chemotaxis protein CheW [Photobacterium atrarenae]UTV27008.1 chemotaxis protein CheW [Photobacterium atrarenae]